MRSQRGRWERGNIHLDTFSFHEFLLFKGIPHTTELERLNNRIEIFRAKEEYLKWGGFYEVMEAEDESIKKDILISYIRNILYQDIVPRYNIRNTEVVERLLFYLLSNATTQLNYSTLSDMFGVSDKTIKEYIGHFEDVFLFRRIDRFHNKTKERIKSTKKIYALDNGLLHIAPMHSKNLGRALENWVFGHLSMRYEDIYYLKDSKEVDFYADNTLYQVSYDIDDKKTFQRELNTFDHFKTTATQKCLITFDDNREEGINGVDVVSVDEFVLG